MQRYSRFWPAAAVDTGGAITGLVTAVVAALISPDYRAILWGLGAQAAGGVLLSHVFAYRIPYGIGFHPARMKGALQFGLPLLVNGLALAAAYQLDRMAVGAWLGVSALGIYGVSVTLLLQPVALLSRLATAILHPRMSAASRTDPAATFPRLVHQLARYSSLLGAAGAAVTICLGAPMLRLVFGPSFTASDTFFVLMAGVVLTRLHRYALNLIGLAIGRTSDMMLSNIAGAVAVPAMIGAFYISHDLTTAAFGTLVGDLLSFAVIDAKLSWRCGSAHRAMRHGVILAAIFLVALGSWVLLSSPPIWLRAVVALMSLIAPVSILLAKRATRHASVVAS